MGAYGGLIRLQFGAPVAAFAGDHGREYARCGVSAKARRALRTEAHDHRGAVERKAASMLRVLRLADLMEAM